MTFWGMPFHNKFHGKTFHDMTFKDMTFVHILKILQIPEDTNFLHLSCQVGFIVLKDNKKVLLHEYKKHTAHHVASTHYAVPVGGTPQSRSQVMMGVPSSQVRTGSGYSHPANGGYPFPGQDGSTPNLGPRSGGDTPFPGQDGGTPIQVLGQDLGLENIPFLTREGGMPHPDLGKSTPFLTWEGYTPHPDLRREYPHPHLRREYPPVNR